MTSFDIQAALAERYSAPEWATFFELRDGAGFNALRTLDMFAMNTWPSKGHNTVAVEIKVSRADFFRETNNPRKRESAESVARECYFATPKGLVTELEVPKGWGLIEVNNGKCRTVVKAQQGSRPVHDESFIAALLKRASEREAHFKNLNVKIGEAEVAAVDLDRYLSGKWWDHLESMKVRYMDDAKKLAKAEIMGDGLEILSARLREEFGWNSQMSFAQQVITLAERAEANQLEYLRGQIVKRNVKSALDQILIVAKDFGIEVKGQ